MYDVRSRPVFAAKVPFMLLTGGIALSGAMLLSSGASGAVIQTLVSSTNQQTYDPNIRSSDLIANGSSFLTGAPVTNGAVSSYPGDVAPFNSWANLTDGLASTKVSNNDISRDAYFDQGSYATNPSIRYNFNTVANPAGFTLTSVNVINGWADTNNFSNQKWTFEISLVGSPNVFSILSTVDYQAFTTQPDGANSSQVTLTDSTGILATGVAAVRFSVLNNGGNGQVIRELDVNGVPEPGTSAILAMGAAGLLLRRRSRA